MTELSKLEWQIKNSVSLRPNAYIKDDTGKVVAFIVDHQDGTYTIQKFVPYAFVPPYAQGVLHVGIDELTAECFVIALRNPER